jgi:hypothetical protein
MPAGICTEPAGFFWMLFALFWIRIMDVDGRDDHLNLMCFKCES